MLTNHKWLSGPDFPPELQTKIYNCLLDIFHQALKTQSSWKQNHYFFQEYVVPLIHLEERHHLQTIIQSKNFRANTLLSHSFQPSVDKLIIKLGRICPLLSTWIPLFNLTSLLPVLPQPATLPPVSEVQCIFHSGYIIATGSQELPNIPHFSLQHSVVRRIGAGDLDLAWTLASTTYHRNLLNKLPVIS